MADDQRRPRRSARLGMARSRERLRAERAAREARAMQRWRNEREEAEYWATNYPYNLDERDDVLHPGPRHAAVAVDVRVGMLADGALPARLPAELLRLIAEHEGAALGQPPPARPLVVWEPDPRAPGSS